MCHFPTSLNLSDTLSRRSEAYHFDLNNNGHNGHEEKRHDGIPSIHDISDLGEDLTKLIVYDSYDKISLLDHFLGEQASYKGYAMNDYPEEGNFVHAEYSIKDLTTTSDEIFINLVKKGLVASRALQIDKSIKIQNRSSIEINYLYKNLDSQVISTRFGCEFNLTTYSDQDARRFYLFKESGIIRGVSEIGAEDNVTGFELVNDSDKLRLIFKFSTPVSCWFYPIMTVSKSEEGFEYTYQGTSLLFIFPLNIEPEKKEFFHINLDVNNII